MTEEQSGRGPLRVVLLGLYGSKAKHLRPLKHFYEGRGAEVQPFIADALRGLRMRDGFRLESRAFVDALASAHARDPRPLVIHAFSNAGFWTSLGVLEEMRARHPELFQSFAGMLLDSAPGISESISLRFAMTNASRALMPNLLASLGLTPRPEHPILTPLAMAFFGFWYLAGPAQIRALETTLPRMRAMLRGKPCLFFWGGADDLVAPANVERFVDSCEREGALVERCFFPGSPHVRHLIGHRAAYLERTSKFIASIRG